MGIGAWELGVGSWRSFGRTPPKGLGQDVQLVVHLPEKITARLVDKLSEPRHVDADQRAVTLANRAPDDHRIHVAHVCRLDDGAQGAVQRIYIHPVGPDHHDVGFFTRRERSAFVRKAGVGSAARCRALEHVAKGQQGGAVGHIGEQVVSVELA